MEKVTQRKQRILDALDEEIAGLEKKLEKVQPYVDELQQLRKTRATLLSERSATGSVGARSQLTMETVIHTLREKGSMTAVDLAKACGVDPSIARSHLNRYRDTRYEQNGDGEWTLIGEEE